MQHRTDQEMLLQTLSAWNSFLKKKVRLIACGGTALTLLKIKESTKDIDLIVPIYEEYNYLIKTLSDIGYKQVTGAGWEKDKGFIFDLYCGKRIFTTELLESPLRDGNNIPFREFTYIYLGILNIYDLIISKIFRSSPVDIEDCKALYFKRRKEIDLEKLRDRFLETSSYDIADEKNKKNLEYYLREITREDF